MIYIPLKIYVYRRYMIELNGIYKTSRNLMFLVIARVAMGLIFSPVFSFISLLVLPQFTKSDSIYPVLFLLPITHPIVWFLFLRFFYPFHESTIKTNLRAIGRGTLFSVLTDIALVVQFFIFGKVFLSGFC